MAWKTKRTRRLGVTAAVCASILLAACSVKFQMNGTSIDYTRVKTVSLDKFPIRSAYVWSPMESMFYNTFSDAFAKKTKLTVIKRGGDLQFAGEITEYSQTNKSVAADGYSAQTQLKMTVNVRYVNQSNHSEDFEKAFSSTTVYDSSQQLAAVQEQLVQEMIDDIVDQIFNATIANW